MLRRYPGTKSAATPSRSAKNERANRERSIVRQQTSVSRVFVHAVSEVDRAAVGHTEDAAEEEIIMARFVGLSAPGVFVAETTKITRG